MARKANKSRKAGAAAWYLKLADGREYGPLADTVLREWATSAKLAPDSVISQDAQTWVAVHTLSSLGMIWIAYESGGSQYGPFNLAAAAKLLQNGSLSSESILANTVTGKTVPLKTLVKVDVVTAARESAEAAPEETAGAPATEKKEQKKYEGAWSFPLRSD